MEVLSSPGLLRSLVGRSIGPSQWLTIDQRTIDAFADATGDRQWIHVDVDRAKREAPGGRTIAHGYLLLALVGTLMPTVLEVKAERILNYGLNKVRFLAPVPADSKVCLSLEVHSAEESAAGLRVTYAIKLELEDAPKPAMVAEIVFVYA